MSLLDYLPYLMHLVQLVAIFALWLRKPGEDAGAAVTDMKGRLDVIEERIKHMPSTAELNELEGTVLAVKTQLENMSEAVRGTRAAVTRIEDFLLRNR